MIKRYGSAAVLFTAVLGIITGCGWLVDIGLLPQPMGAFDQLRLPSGEMLAYDIFDKICNGSEVSWKSERGFIAFFQNGQWHYPSAPKPNNSGIEGWLNPDMINVGFEDAADWDFNDVFLHIDKQAGSSGLFSANRWSKLTIVQAGAEAACSNPTTIVFQPIGSLTKYRVKRSWQSEEETHLQGNKPLTLMLFPSNGYVNHSVEISAQVAQANDEESFRRAREYARRELKISPDTPDPLLDYALEKIHTDTGKPYLHLVLALADTEALLSEIEARIYGGSIHRIWNRVQQYQGCLVIEALQGWFPTVYLLLNTVCLAGNLVDLAFDLIRGQLQRQVELYIQIRQAPYNNGQGYSHDLIRSLAVERYTGCIGTHVQIKVDCNSINAEIEFEEGWIKCDLTISQWGACRPIPVERNDPVQVYEYARYVFEVQQQGKSSFDRDKEAISQAFNQKILDLQEELGL